jgi:hypothetical protein
MTSLPDTSYSKLKALNEAAKLVLNIQDDGGNRLRDVKCILPQDRAIKLLAEALEKFSEEV